MIMTADAAVEPAKPAGSRGRPGSGRRMLSVVGAGSAVGGALTILIGLPAMWRMGWLDGVGMTILVGGTMVGAIAVLLRPTLWAMLVTAAASAALVAVWLLAEVVRILPAPDPFIPINAAVGFTSWLAAGLLTLAFLSIGVQVMVTGRRTRSVARRRWQAIAGFIAGGAVLVLVLLMTALGVVTASAGFSGPAVPAATVAPTSLPAGQRSTVEYCRRGGVRLPMDIYLPSASQRGRGPAPVVMYVHGGGLVLGDRRTTGLGSSLAGQDGALFLPLQRRLTAVGFVVASIDYRLTPGADWRAPIGDAKCAVRFLRAHAADLGIDPTRIGVWGSSAGGQLVSLLGLAGPDAGFDTGQYAAQSSRVEAVVDMFGPSDVLHFGDSSAFTRFILWASLGDSPDVRRRLSPITYVHSGAPPFLILQGRQDSNVLGVQSATFAQRLNAVGVPVRLVMVSGTGHSMDTPGQRPTPEQVTDRVVQFFRRTLAKS